MKVHGSATASTLGIGSDPPADPAVVVQDWNLLAVTSTTLAKCPNSSSSNEGNPPSCRIYKSSAVSQVMLEQFC